VAEIAAASKEQAQGIDQINRAVSEMDRVVQRNAASAEESASAAEEMTAQAEQMKGTVSELMALVGGSEATLVTGKDSSKGLIPQAEDAKRTGLTDSRTVKTNALKEGVCSGPGPSYPVSKARPGQPKTMKKEDFKSF
jgi:methyl-accepting chemotaxis protein